MYTVALDNMMFGGSSPTFAEEFTVCNYIIKYYTIGCCGLCGFPVKVWVDKCIVMGEPKFYEEMAEQDAQADAANPKELSRRFSNQSASGPPSLLDPTRRVSFVSAEEQNRSNAAPQQVEVVVMQPESKKAAAPESLAALLAACGLEHHEETFKAEGYTLDTLLSSMAQGKEAVKSDLRELKLTLGECRKLINHLGASTSETMQASEAARALRASHPQTCAEACAKRSHRPSCAGACAEQQGSALPAPNLSLDVEGGNYSKQFNVPAHMPPDTTPQMRAAPPASQPAARKRFSGLLPDHMPPES